MSTAIDRVAKVGFATALAILVLIGGLSYEGTRRLIETEEAVSRSQEVMNRLDDLLVEVLEEESASRAYLVAGQDFYLEPYYDAVQRVGRTLADIESAAGEDPKQLQALEGLKGIINEKVAHHSRMIELRKRTGTQASLQLFFTGRGHALMDQIRDRVNHMKERENRFLREQTRMAQRRAETSVLTQVSGSLLSFGILLSVYYHLTQAVGKRRQSERKILQVNRLYAVLSRVSQAIVRIRERQPLFDAICRIAVEDDLFRMAWMGVVDPATGEVRPVASAGFVDGYLERIRVTTSEAPEGQGPTGRALRERRHFVCSSILPKIKRSRADWNRRSRCWMIRLARYLRRPRKRPENHVRGRSVHPTFRSEIRLRTGVTPP